MQSAGSPQNFGFSSHCSRSSIQDSWGCHDGEDSLRVSGEESRLVSTTLLGFVNSESFIRAVFQKLNPTYCVVILHK